MATKQLKQVTMKTTLFVTLTLTVIALKATSQEIDFLFEGFKTQTTANLTLTETAEIQQNGILKLTNDSRRMIGHAFSASPVRLKNLTTNKAFSFSTSFAFTIVPEYPKLGGHGLAFTIVASKDLKALPSQYLGLLNATDNNGNASNHLFAVEFDTVQDFEFGDINDNHVGINLNSMNSSASAPASFSAGGEIQNFSLNGKAIKAWIDYDSDLNLLNVTVAPFSDKPSVPLLSYPIDLSPVLNEFMYVGFSASTGLLASSHYILGWSFKTNGQSKTLDLSSLPHVPGPKKSRTTLAISASASSIFLFAAAISAAVFLFFKIKNADPIESWEFEFGPHRYTYDELKKATKNFRDRELLGYGGFGRVYKGTLPKSKTIVAVKRISHESRQGLREFVSEISTIGRLRHRNLVQLMGWCRRRGDLILIYDFMENGSLDKFLFDEPVRVLSWEQRMKIINGVASALLYLHEGFEQVVIHRDVKASNVLLDADLNGRLGDFGLARLHDHGANMSTTRVVGTLGYLAPELPRTGKATTASDVYAFGALLLEVLTGRRPIEPKASSEELVLVDWVWDKYKQGNLLEVVDKRLCEKYDAVEADMVARLGLTCSNNSVSVRPSMRQIVRYLEGEILLPEVLRDPLGEWEGRKGGFEDFVQSFPSSSSFDGLSKSHSFGGVNRDGFDGSFVSVSTSPLSLLRGRGLSD